MQSTALTVDHYFEALPPGRKEAMNKLRLVILQNIPKGFAEVMNYGMPAYVVPHSLYPAGYHCDSSLPVGLISIASQKNFIAVYHMGIYADTKLYDWFLQQYAVLQTKKPDIGKSCIRFKDVSAIPYKLIGELAAKLSVADWIKLYEKNIKKQQDSKV